MAALVGQWDFDDPADLGKATVGEPLELAGDATPVDGYGSGDGAVAIGIGSHFRCRPGLAPNGGSTVYVNEYTLVFDLWLPAESDHQWRTLFQTNPANTNDGDYFISPSNTLGVGDLAYSTSTLPAGHWYRIVFSADIGSNIDGGAPASSFLSVVTDDEGSHWTFRHNQQALNGRHSLTSTANENLLLLFCDENAEDALLHVSRVQIYDSPLSETEALALGAPVPSDPDNRPPGVAPGSPGPTSAGTGETVAFSFQATDEDADEVAVIVDWGDGLSSTSERRPAGEPLLLEHVWKNPGNYPITVRARDEHGATSDPVVVQTVSVTGAPVVTILTPPYLQNVRTDGIVIMVETAENTGLAVSYGETLSLGQTEPMTRTASGGGTWFQRAVLTGLTPEGEYYYRVTSPDGSPLSGLAHFHTAPDREVDFKFSAWSDSQGHNRGVWTVDPLEPTVSMMKHMVASGVAFGFAVGDMAEDGNSYADTRQYYLDRVARHLGSSVPWFTAWGNHDSSSPSAPLRLASDMPSRYRAGLSPGHGSFAFTYANCFFVCLDEFYRTEITNGWLEQQLASPAAQNARFRFLGIHVPPYCERWIDGNAVLRNTLVPLLEKYKVNICFSGHTHEYERGFLNHVHYVITGGGSWLDHTEVVVRDWEHMTVGGAHDVPAQWASQSSPGVLGAPKAIVGGLFNEYTLITIRDRFLRLETQAFNADGSHIGVLDSFEIGADPGPDTDGDGLRDAWETAHGLDPEDAEGPHGAHGDPDGDGQSNRAEFLAGTHPDDATSVFDILQAITEDAGMLTITWASVPGKLYGLSLTRDLTTWIRVHDGAEPLVLPAAAAGNTTQYSLPLPDDGRWFARLHVEP